MADISVTRNHDLAHDELHSRLEKLADEMTRKFGITARWDGDTCHLSGNPLKNGTLSMTDTAVLLELELGMMAKMLKGTIIKEIDSRLDKLLA